MGKALFLFMKAIILVQNHFSLFIPPPQLTWQGKNIQTWGWKHFLKNFENLKSTDHLWKLKVGWIIIYQVVPWNSELKADDHDAFFLSNGPGDPQVVSKLLSFSFLICQNPDLRCHSGWGEETAGFAKTQTNLWNLPWTPGIHINGDGDGDGDEKDNTWQLSSYWQWQPAAQPTRWSEPILVTLSLLVAICYHIIAIISNPQVFLNFI